MSERGRLADGSQDMLRRFILGSFVVALLTSLPPAALAQNRERQQIMAEIRMLHEQTMRLQLLISSLGDTLDELTGRLETQSEETVRAFADQRLLVDTVADDVRVLREKLDDTNVRISSMSQEIEALRIAIPPIPLTFDPDASPEAGARPPQAEGNAPVSPVPLAPGMSPQRMYDTAWADYTNGQWELAIEGFEAYLDTFPRSELADDAQFYIGQTYYADGRFEEAVTAFDLVLRNYPNGDVVPEASYKRGLALDRLGEPERARAAFEDVVERHPDSTMATLARQALERLSQP